MEKFIAKLHDVKKQLELPPNSYSFEKEKFNNLIDRAVAIIDKKYGEKNVFTQRLSQLKKNDYSSVRDNDLENLKTLIDIIIDDLELTETKQKEIIAPMLEEQHKQQVDLEIKNLNNKIFIVHGHDEVMKQSVARVIEKLNLHPIILHEQSNQGQTIIEKFLTNSNVGFAIILLSADDMGYSIKEGQSKAKKRARQNIIFELGFFTAKLGRKKVIALVDTRGDFELPSDIYGVIYLDFDGAAGKWKFDVAKELAESGFSIDLNKIA